MGGLPPPHVRAALRRSQDWDDATGHYKPVDEEQGRKLLEVSNDLGVRLNRRHKKRAEVERQVVEYLERVVLPVSDDPWLPSLIEGMKSCHGKAVWYWHESAHKTVVRWNAKCECVQLCPHAAAEEAERMQERYVLRFEILKTLGYTLQKVVISPPCVARHEPVKAWSPKGLRDWIIEQRWQSFCNADDRELAKAWKLTEIGSVQNRLKRTMLRMLTKTQKMLTATWPRSLSRRFYLLKIDDSPENRDRYRRGRKKDADKGDREFYQQVHGKKGRLFPELEGLQVTIESPMNYEGLWHPHLNVLYAFKGPCIDWELMRRYWNNAHCHWTTEEQMWTTTAARLRARGEDPSTMTWRDVLRHALKEVVKYPLATVAEKSGKNKGSWSGDEAGEGRYTTEAGKQVAPPMVDWPGDAFMEWWYAHYDFRRSRSYGALFRGVELEGGTKLTWSELEADPSEAPDPLLWTPMGTVTRERGEYRVSLPLLTFLPGNNSYSTGPPTADNPATMTPEQRHRWLVSWMRVYEYRQQQTPQGF